MAVVPIVFTPAVRVIPRFPPISEIEQFEEDLQAAVLAELDRVSPGIVGDLRLLPPSPLPLGSGASYIITSYTFGRPGRFNDHTFSAFYVGDTLATALCENGYHLLRSLRESHAPPQVLPPRLVLHVDVRALRIVDARSASYPEIYNPNNYTESNTFGLLVHEHGHEGIVFHSVRHPGGVCVAVYTPTVLSNCRADGEVVYRYTGARLETSYGR
jgi:hypothetical protein